MNGIEACTDALVLTTFLNLMRVSALAFAIVLLGREANRESMQSLLSSLPLTLSIQLAGAYIAVNWLDVKPTPLAI